VIVSIPSIPLRIKPREQFALGWSLLKWCILGALVGLLSGVASTAFLIGLGWATTTREAHPWLLWLLPVAGAAIGWIYNRFGKEVEGGNNLLLERIHDPEGEVPLRMAPLIALATIGTHLFGGSAGREGTAVQMGGSLTNLISWPLRLPGQDRRILLMSGISGGFGSVFGTPLAGTIFGLEVLTVGRIRYDALIPCFVASTVGDMVCRGLGIYHHLYSLPEPPQLTAGLLLAVGVAGLLFGIASLLFSELTHVIQHATKAWFKIPWLRPFVGGLAVILLTILVGNHDYLGLGLPLIERSFTPAGVFLGAFALKIVFTSVTLGSGFKGGEVTPLFCIGATLGYAFASLTGQPTAMFAALGFVAVFAGAANTPLACILMGIELFGAGLAVPLTLACIVSYITSGHRGIYLSQQVDTPKASTILVPDGVSLRDAHAGGLEVGMIGMQPPDPRVYPSPSEETFLMSDDPSFSSRPLGQLRIFLRSGDRPKATNWKERLNNPPVYLRILQKARNFGLIHGTVKQCISGFIDKDQIQHDNLEYGNGRLPIYVELHGSREMLEQFCMQSQELLNGRIIVYKDVERWGWHDGTFEEIGVEEPDDDPVLD
jgi:H+/Cl- antiporter ClcA/PII-like signaling protein